MHSAGTSRLQKRSYFINTCISPIHKQKRELTHSVCNSEENLLQLFYTSIESYEIQYERGLGKLFWVIFPFFRDICLIRGKMIVKNEVFGQRKVALSNSMYYKTSKFRVTKVVYVPIDDSTHVFLYVLRGLSSIFKKRL